MIEPHRGSSKWSKCSLELSSDLRIENIEPDGSHKHIQVQNSSLINSVYSDTRHSSRIPQVYCGALCVFVYVCVCVSMCLSRGLSASSSDVPSTALAFCASSCSLPSSAVQAIRSVQHIACQFRTPFSGWLTPATLTGLGSGGECARRHRRLRRRKTRKFPREPCRCGPGTPGSLRVRSASAPCSVGCRRKFWTSILKCVHLHHFGVEWEKWNKQDS